MYHGDIRLGDTIDIKFTTRRGDTGAPTTLSGSPVISAYVGNNTTEITAGVTLTVDFDSRTGLNNVRVVASSGNGFATATNIQLVITTGTVNSVSVVGEVVGTFSIECRSALMPTTAARTLVVDANGLADANVVKVGPTGSGTAQTAGDIYSKVSGLTFTVASQVDVNTKSWAGTAVTTPKTAGTPVVDWVPSGWRSNTAQAGAAGSITLDASASAVDSFYKYTLIQILSGTGAGQARLCTAYVGSTKVATVVPNWTTNPSSDSVFATMPLALSDVEAWLASAATAYATSAQATSLQADTDDIQTRLPAALTANGNMKSSLLEIISTALSEGAAGRIAAAWQAMWNVTSPVLTAQSVNQSGDSYGRIGATGSGLTSLAPASTALSTAQWTNARAGYLDFLNTGVTLAASAVQAIWDALTSALTTTGSIGKLLVDNINATISSRLASASYTAPDNTTIGTINTKLGTPAGASVSADIAAVSTKLGTPAGASVSADIASVKQNTGTDIPALIAALNNISQAQVKTQVVSALTSDQYGEPGQGVPPDTASIERKISWNYKAFRNKSTQTDSLYALFNSGATVVDQKADCSDDNVTFVRGEISSGP